MYWIQYQFIGHFFKDSYFTIGVRKEAYKMKKSIITFCALVLLSTQAPATSEAATTGGESGVRYEKLNKFVQTYKYKTIVLNKDFKNWNLVSDFIEFKKSNPVKEKVSEKETVVKKQPATNVTEEKVPATETTKKPTTEVEKKPEVTTEQPKAPVTEVTTEQPKAPETTTQSNASQNTTPTTTPTTSTSSTIDAIEAAVVELTNAERAKAGLQPLKAYAPLMAAAREKSQDMKDKNYFSHTSPTYGSPFDRLKALGISYQAAGENIAKGQRTAEEVVTAWMNSEGHRANILDSKFTHIGVGYVKDGNIWTQQFIKQ